MPQEPFTYDVFVSYSHKDAATVRPIAEQLRSAGLKVWFDDWELKPGDNDPKKLDDALEQSRVLVFCMSQHAFGSDWSRLEAGTFRFRDPLNEHRRFIPLRLDDAPIKSSLAQFLYIDWRDPAARPGALTKLRDACSPPTLHTQEERRPFELAVVSLEHTAYVYNVAWSPDRRQALSGSSDNTLRLWDVKTGRCLRVLEGHTKFVLSVAWSPDGRRALSGSGDNTVRLWDVESGRCLRALIGHTSYVRSVAWSPDGQRALSGSFDYTVRLWDVASGCCLRVLDGHTSSVLGVAWSPDGRRALSGSIDKTLRLWDVESGRIFRVFESPTGEVFSVDWSPDGRRALSGSSDKTVRLWDVESGRCLRVLEGHTSYVRGVAWSPDGRRALSGSGDKTVRLWEVESGRCLRVLEGHASTVYSLAWCPDGRRVLSAAADGGLRSWNPKLDELEAPPGRAQRADFLGSPQEPQVQYTNAKVLLVGESGAGKTGLTERLVHRRPPTRAPSTSGAWSTQLSIPDIPQEPGWEREIWLWDFGGQADQRLIHQLYLDNAALILLLFNSDQDTVLPGLREWQLALSRTLRKEVPTLLVAGRTDVGRRFDRQRVLDFAKQRKFDYFETSAETADGIHGLEKALIDKIPWKELTTHNSPLLCKRLKDEILKLRDEGFVLVTKKELVRSYALVFPPV